MTLYHILPTDQSISSTTSKIQQTRPTKSALTAVHSSTTNPTTTTTFKSVLTVAHSSTTDSTTITTLPSTASLNSRMNQMEPPKTTNAPTIEDYVFEFHVQTNQEENINNTTHLEEESTVKQE